jgi:lysophospholipase L1-like esterase
LFSRLTLALILVSCTAFCADSTLKKGDKIVFFGDSITQGGGGKNGYITVIKETLTAKHPDLGLEFVNAGISGHKVTNLQARVDKDVIEKKPTIVFIYIGINDVWHFTHPATKGQGTPKDKYEDGLKDLIKRITAAGARVILCTPSVIGEKTGGANPQDAMLDEYSEISRKVATETKTQLCDLHKAFQDYEKANNPDNKDKGILTGDGVHLNEKGNKLVADEMMKALQ